jgi:hypothetical protein
MARIFGRSWVLPPSRTRLCRGNWGWQSSSSCIAQVLTSPATEKRYDNRRNDYGVPANYLRQSLQANSLQSGYKHVLQWPDFLLVELSAAVGTAWTLLGLTYLVTLYLFEKRLLCGEFIHRFTDCGSFINRKHSVVHAYCFHPYCTTSSVPPYQSQRLTNLVSNVMKFL